MSRSPRLLKSTALLLSGAALGGAGGYAASASGASPAHAAAKASRTHAKGQRGRLRRAVTITAVVPNGNGSFTTVTVERGTLLSSANGAVTLREGTLRSTYKTVTLSLPSDTVVRLERKPSSLTSLSAGDRVAVVQGPRKTTVIARPPAGSSTSAASATESSSSS